MAQPEVIGAVRSTCESVLVGRGLELVEIKLLGAQGGRVLRVTVDRLGGSVPLDEIAEVSEEISRALDLEDPIPGRYVLEVSSAGIERPLVKPSDYRFFEGSEVNVRCHEPIEGRRSFKGIIRSAGEETFVLHAEAPGGPMPVEIPYSAVARAKLVVDWDKELKGAT